MILAILQARCSSARFPNKVLADLAGKPMILQQIQRLSESLLIDKLVVATSTDPTDDRLVELLTSNNVFVHRGSLDNVLERFVEVIEVEKPDVVVRLTADCPLIDPRVIDKVIEQHGNGKDKYTSNTINPTYPDGLDVECVDPRLLQKLYDSKPSEIECEHVTYGLYKRPRFCNLNSVEQETDYSNLRWTVDLPGDLDFVRRVYAEFAPHYYSFGQDDLIELALSKPGFVQSDTILGRNAGLIEQESGMRDEH
jgi:spore coat polysaccharide biosynthesis protein SpsF